MLDCQNEPKQEKFEQRISNSNRMLQISAKLCSVSFSKQRFQAKVSTENQNLAKWIIACAAMMTLCVPYVYIVPHIAVNPSNNHSLSTSLYDTFEVRFIFFSNSSTKALN